MAFRPEDVRVYEGESSHDNLMTLKVRSREFCGPYIRATLDSPELGSAVITMDISKTMASNKRLHEVNFLDVYIPQNALRAYGQSHLRP